MRVLCKKVFWGFGYKRAISKVKQLNTESKYHVCKRDLKLQWEKAFSEISGYTTSIIKG